MRSTLCTCVLLALSCLATAQRFHFPGRGSRADNVNTRIGFNNSPLISGNTQPSSPTPTGPRGCFCLPANQLCEPNGAIPVGSTRISKIKTKIVNLTPGNCPQDQHECCFGSFVGEGPRPLPDEVLAPITGCGARRSLIPGRANSDDADFGEYPWMVAIVGPDNQFVSGGALISNDWVLTAAHKVTNPGLLKVRAGDYDLAQANEVPQLPHQEFDVIEVIIHPQFNPTNLFNDVALLRLSRPVNFQTHINVACLPEKFQRFNGQRCFVSGWGQNLDGNFQPILKEVDLPILEEFDCQERLKLTRLGASFRLNTESFICAGGEAGKDACSGDGGSPLVCNEGGVYTIVGLVAWGIGCGQNNVPGVYVNVAQFSDFINQNIAHRG